MKLAFVHVEGPLREQCVARLEKAASYDAFGGLASAAEALRGHRVYAITTDRDGVQVVVGAYACQLNTWARGREMCITAAAAIEGVEAQADLVRAIDDHAESVAIYEGCRYLTCITAREGLVRKLAARGWSTSGRVLNREIA